VSEKAIVKQNVRWAALGAALLWTASGQASPMYPGALKDDIKALTGLDMPCTPPCTLCHADLQGGRGTVIKPFGVSMMNNGLTYQDTASLARALTAVKAKAVDSDGDGVADIDEISVGHDPDVNGDGQLCGAAPQYGCGARIARARPSDRSWLTGAIALLVLTWVRATIRVRLARRGSRRRAHSD
jgi:hypothetical protein